MKTTNHLRADAQTKLVDAAIKWSERYKETSWDDRDDLQTSKAKTRYAFEKRFGVDAVRAVCLSIEEMTQITNKILEDLNNDDRSGKAQ